MRLLIIVLFLFYSTAFTNEWHTVKYVIDGDTFVTNSGVTVRLLGINTPEAGHGSRPPEAMGIVASNFAKKLLIGKKVRLVTQNKKYDKYGRLLAQVYLPSGKWVNKTLLDKGYAHVYTFPDNRAGIADLLAAESVARKAGKGLWALPEWRVRQATSCCEDSDAGRFVLVQGTVKKVATRKGVTYLNFGDDWRTDFTIEIKKKFKENFMPNPARFYRDKTIIIHGRVKPVNGWLISASHLEQIEIVK